MGGVYFCFDIKDEFLVEEKKMCGILFKKEVVLKFMKTNITSTHENALVIAQKLTYEQACNTSLS